METPVLELKDICFSYNREAPILTKLSLKVKNGESVALLGESGSGKSTLLRVICGLETPKSGDILLGGDSVIATPTEKRGIGLLFQDYNLFPHLRIVDNVAFGLTSRRREKRDAALVLLQEAGMEHYARRYPHEISGGEQQRIALLRALILKPRVMLLDEPFSNLDATTKEETAGRTFALLCQNKVPVIMVTHNPLEARHLTQRQITMEELKNHSESSPAK